MPIANDYEVINVGVHETPDRAGLSFTWHARSAGSAAVTVPMPKLAAWSTALAEAEQADPPTIQHRILADLGEDAFAALFTVEVCTLWNNALRGNDGPVRIVFHYSAALAATMAKVPLETMRVSQRSPIQLERVVGEVIGGPDLSLVRSVYGAPDLAHRALLVDLPLRILVVASEPTDLEPHMQLPGLRGELAYIQGVFKGVGATVHVDVLEPGRGASTFARLVEKGKRAHVIHFMGHGRITPDGRDAQLLLETAAGKSDWHSGTELTQELLQGSIRLWVLNGCQTAAAGILACRFPAVVGTLLSVFDISGAALASGLYDKLTDTAQLDEAMCGGRRLISRHDVDSVRFEKVKPVLYMHSESGVLTLLKPYLASNQLASAVRGEPYTAELPIRGGRGPHAFSATGLPAGLRMDAGTGVISGVPTAAGTFPVRLRITSRDHQSADLSVNLVVIGDDVLHIVTSAIEAVEGNYVDQVLCAERGRQPYVWSFEGTPALQCRPWGAVRGYMPGALERAAPLRAVVHDGQGDTAQREIALRSQPNPTPPQGFVTVPAGPFALGYHPTPARDRRLNYLHNQGQAMSANLARENWPAAVVHLDAYAISAVPVTNEQYMPFVHETGRANPMSAADDRAAGRIMQHPVTNVTFDDALAYCQWRTARAAQAGEPWVYRLPTDWEWEKAARGPWVSDDPLSGRLFPWGDDWGKGNAHGSNAADLTTAPAAMRGASPLGVGDLIGNVAEWVDSGGFKDGSSYRHVRGGGWNNVGPFEGLCFATNLTMAETGCHENWVGFRCVAVPAAPPPAQALVRLGGDVFTTSQGEREYIAPFELARFAVSNEEYRAFKPGHAFAAHERHWPVVNVSLRDAEAFCEWKSQQGKRLYCLPTRAHLERAALGTTRRKYPWLADEAGGPRLDLPAPLRYPLETNSDGVAEGYCRYLCNSLESGHGRRLDVFALPAGATPEGVYQLCGNVFEWISDKFAVGGSWLATCKSYGAWPYEDGDLTGCCGPQEGVGFRYMTYST